MVGKGAALGLLAVAALAGVALASGWSGKHGLGVSGGATQLDGQPYFNSLPTAKQNAILSALYDWYVGISKTGGWPQAVQDPALQHESDLKDAGNFWLAVDAYQQLAYPDASSNYHGSAGVLDELVAGSLGVS